MSEEQIKITQLTIGNACQSCAYWEPTEPDKSLPGYCVVHDMPTTASDICESWRQHRPETLDHPRIMIDEDAIQSIERMSETDTGESKFAWPLIFFFFALAAVVITVLLYGR